MAEDRLLDETEYDEARAEELASNARRAGVSRRELLQAAALGLPALAGLAGLADVARAQASAPAVATPQPGRAIVKPLPAEWFTPLGTNAETRFSSLRDIGYVVPNDRFFVRNHTRTPAIDAATWRLQVFGSGLRGGRTAARPYEIGFDALTRLPSQEVFSSIECAGNGRSFFGTQQGTPFPGSQWTLGAIGVARWRGVPLAEVLERAGLTKAARDVMPEGLDPVVVQNGVDAGHVRRPLSVAKALEDALLVYEMNDAPLPLDHGHPVRLLVPGWVGIANVKWVGRIEVSRTPLASLWNTSQYRFFGAAYPPGGSAPLTRQSVKSAFELPLSATVPAGPTILTGRSWSGAGAIRKVVVSTDGGATWQRVPLRGRNLPNAWVQWALPWTATPGSHTLLARATDTEGRKQPFATVPNDLGYGFDAVVRHPVTVV